MPPLTNKLHHVTWRDVFVLVDYGRAQPSDYAILGEIVVAEAALYPGGIGALTIVPRDATPPSEKARVAMNEVMRSLGPSIRCLCWLVEGEGFQGAMVRGVLTGVRMFGRLPYASHIATDMGEALEWIVRRLDGDDRRLAVVPDGVRWIQEKRQRSERERPPHGA